MNCTERDKVVMLRWKKDFSLRVAVARGRRGGKALLSASGAGTEVDTRSHSAVARVEHCNRTGIQRRAVGRVRGSLNGKKHRCYPFTIQVREMGGYLPGTWPG